MGPGKPGRDFSEALGLLGGNTASVSKLALPVEDDLRMRAAALDRQADILLQYGRVHEAERLAWQAEAVRDGVRA